MGAVTTLVDTSHLSIERVTTLWDEAKSSYQEYQLQGSVPQIASSSEVQLRAVFALGPVAVFRLLVEATKPAKALETPSFSIWDHLQD